MICPPVTFDISTPCRFARSTNEMTHPVV